MPQGGFPIPPAELVVGPLGGELGGLMEQDTNGKVQHIRKTITNEPDGGIDFIRSISSDFDYFEYIERCKEVSNE